MAKRLTLMVTRHMIYLTSLIAGDMEDLSIKSSFAPDLSIRASYANFIAVGIYLHYHLHRSSIPLYKGPLSLRPPHTMPVPPPQLFPPDIQ